MARPLRIEVAGATYHVTSRGDRKEPIFIDETDQAALLWIVEQACRRFDAVLLAYCLMGNHYHLVITTRAANLSLAMRHVNGVYTQRFNRRHDKVGHLFQGRFHAILVDCEPYLAELCRYVELNPVRGGLVRAPEDWRWSSYRAHLGIAHRPWWLDVDRLHAWLLGFEARTPEDARRAVQLYRELVMRCPEDRLWDRALKQQIYLGDDAFVQRMQAHAQAPTLAAPEIPKAQRQGPTKLEQWIATSGSRDESIYRAHNEGGMKMSSIAKEAGLSRSRVSRIVLAARKRLEATKKT